MILLLACHGGEEGARIERNLPEAEQYTVATDDGAAIALTRRPNDGLPVLIVHGISGNHH